MSRRRPSADSSIRPLSLPAPGESTATRQKGPYSDQLTSSRLCHKRAGDGPVRMESAV
ncbi:MAG: hypothetical protein MZV64_04775 [Ignavibacteriales bacterium]|nr:hypothetical protein [Ignavibacteriales bacterium]